MTRNPEVNEGRYVVGCVATIAVSLFLAIIALVASAQSELVAEVAFDDITVAKIYAEPEFMYEGPGYLSIVVTSKGQDIVRPYAFMPDKGMRLPDAPLSATVSLDGNVACIKQYSDVVFMIDLEDKNIWPPYTWNVRDFSPDVADQLLARLNDGRARPLTCLRLERLRAGLARRTK